MIDGVIYFFLLICLLVVLEGPMERIQEDSMEQERKETRENHQVRDGSLFRVNYSIYY